MATRHTSRRPIVELSAKLGDEISASLGKEIAVSLIQNEDNTTDIIFHDRRNGGLADVPEGTVGSIISAHKRPPLPVTFPFVTPVGLPPTNSAPTIPVRSN